MQLTARSSLATPLLAACLAVVTQMTFAQSASSASAIPVIQTGTELVVVDVAVQDKDGRPVRNLRREDFTLTEDKQPQSVRYFETNSSDVPAAMGPKLPPMPPGTFTDYTAVPPSGALNILLLDTLNTPMADQSYVRDQLRKFIRKAKPGTRIAIFGLSRRLFLLQGFSSDSEVLKEAVEKKLTPRASSLLEDAQGSGNTPDNPSDIAAGIDGQLASTISSMQQFEAEQKSFETQLRIQYTLDAFNMLAHYLSAFQGRKNLMWFSGSFPINILPDPSISNGFAVTQNNGAEYRETINLLARAQVAVYPLDARGLLAAPTFSVSTSQRSLASGATQPGKTSSDFYQSQAAEHMTMSQLAEDTGGAAFYNTNDLASAVEKAIQDGSNYYTLVYAPKDRNWNGAYREIRVSLNGSLQAMGYRLSYRRGYYADDPSAQPRRSSETAAGSATSGALGGSDAYARAAMAHGSPAPQDILFKVRVLPIAAAPQQALATTNVTNPAHPLKPPFRLFAVDFAVVGNDIQLTPTSDGRRTGAIEFNVLLFDNDGALLNATGKTVQLNLTPDAYKRFLGGVTGHFEISVPVKGGGSDFLRIGIHDISSNRFGVVEVPIASVASLQAVSEEMPSTSPEPPK